MLTRLPTATSCKLQATSGLRRAEGLSEPGDSVGRGREANSRGISVTQSTGSAGTLGQVLQHPAMERADTVDCGPETPALRA